MSVTEQLEKVKEFFARKYPNMKYLAYFQAYTNTYAELQHLKELYEDLPEECRNYSEFIEKRLGYPITMISLQMMTISLSSSRSMKRTSRV